jgi:hypothetical protein
MAATTAKLIEVFQSGQERSGVLDLPGSQWPQAGQYLPCQRDDDSIIQPLPINLFRVIGPESGLSVSPLPENWLPGDQLNLLPPHGNGFIIPESARRVGLLAFEVPPLRLLPLIKPALAQNASLTLFVDPHKDKDILNWIPSIVEIVPLSAFAENLSWLDYLAVDLPLERLNALSAILGDTKLTFSGQVLLRTPMPCHGVGECGVCSVKTQHGWRLVCKDGPVFSLEEVINVAG